MQTSIKPKQGKCKDCPVDAPEQPLIAGRCKAHYWQHRKDVNAVKRGNQSRVVVKATLNTFFASQLLQRPLKCECGCNQSIRFSQSWMNRATIAHIVPKRDKGGCQSVSTHPQNRCFLHPECHANLDNLGDVWLKKKPELLSLMRERYQKFAPEIAESERKNVPDYLTEETHR